MNNFWSLVKFEYKKIFARKSVLIALILGLVVVTVFPFGMIWGTDPDTNKSMHEELLIDKNNALALSGRPLDGELILETSRAYQTIPNNIYPYSKSNEYQTYARPYTSVYGLIASTYKMRGNIFGINGLQTISKEDAYRYYDKRINQYRLNLENNPTFTQHNIERVIAIDRHVQKPFIMEYIGGYDRFFALSTTIALVVMFLIVFILSPIFGNEYSQRTDSLILTAKNGKSSQIYAKIFAGISISLTISVLFLVLGYLLNMFGLGFNGAHAPIQLVIPLITYNFTLLKAVAILLITTTLGGFLLTGICLYLSSSIGKSIIVLALSTLIALLGTVNLPTFMEKPKRFFPSSMGSFWDIVGTQYSWSIFGIDIWLYQAVCIVAVVLGTVLLALSFRSFKRHQAG